MRQWSDWSVAEQNWIKDKQFDLSMFADKINYELFIQHVFQKQWLELKTYANNKNIQIMGDIPIYLGFDSLDVWQNQEMFLLDENNQPSFVAGVPPDYFSATGQRWGNPIYAWDKLEATEFEFWINRLRINSQMYDIIRIDHFRAFDTYWQIPAECQTAVIGEWIEAPGYKLFETIYKKLPDIKIVVEDLGDLRPQVLELRDKFKLAGMQVFQFVYQTNGNNHALENTQNTIVYTGTHDNETLMGWYYRQNKWQRKQLKKVFRANDLTIKNKIIKAVLSYQADYVIFPVQDLIGLGNSARINFPGKIGSPNWEWKLSDLSTLDNLAKWFAEQVIKNKR
jgi:4-alpha-glucanotransferase